MFQSRVYVSKSSPPGPNLPSNHLMGNTHQAWKFLIRHASYTEVYQLLQRVCWFVGTAVHELGEVERRSCKEETIWSHTLSHKPWATSVTASWSYPIQSSSQKTTYPSDYVDNFPTRVLSLRHTEVQISFHGLPSRSIKSKWLRTSIKPVVTSSITMTKWTPILDFS